MQARIVEGCRGAQGRSGDRLTLKGAEQIIACGSRLGWVAAPRAHENALDLAYTGIPLAAVLFVGILLLLEAGRRVGVRRKLRDPEGAGPGAGALEAAVYGLLGLLIAFTFSGAASRFDARRQLVVEEANAIGTAYLRIDLLSPSPQPALRESFRRYLDARLELYHKLPDVAAARVELDKDTALQAGIWA